MNKSKGTCPSVCVHFNRTKAFEHHLTAVVGSLDVCCSSSVSFPLTDSADVPGTLAVSSGFADDTVLITGITHICHGGNSTGKYFDTMLLI